jgi:serine/threonine-protein kinase
MIADALEGLHCAHEMHGLDGKPLELVHRDMSPNNIFVTYDGVVKILDFGIAKGASSQATRSGILRGTVGYMAPEQARGEPLDRRTDLYAVGVILWETIVGRRVWEGLNDVAIINRLVQGSVPTPRSVNPHVPEELDRICRCALAPHDERYATARELQADLERYLASIGASFTPRDMGSAVAETFAKVRASTRAIIEEQLSHPSPPSARSVPALPVPSGPILLETPSRGHESVRTLTADVLHHAPPSRSFFATWRFAVVAIACIAAAMGLSSLRRRATNAADGPARVQSASVAAAPASSVVPAPSLDPSVAGPAPSVAASASSASVAASTPTASTSLVPRAPVDRVRPAPSTPAVSATIAEPAPTPPRTPPAPSAQDTKKRRLDTQDPFE